MGILLDEMFDRVRVESGKWITKKENLEMKIAEFDLLAETAIGTYNQYRPYHEERYRVTTAQDGRVFFTLREPQKGIPLQVAGVVPAIEESVFSSFAAIFGFTTLNRLRNNRRVYWKYQRFDGKNGTLITDYVGQVDVNVLFNRQWLRQEKVNPVLAGSGNVGNGTLSNVSVLAGVVPQNFIVTCIAAQPGGGVFSVSGSNTPYAFPNARVGIAYTSDVSFILGGGVIDFAIGDTFTIPIVTNPTLVKELVLFDNREDELYIQLLTARFMKALGSSRRSFVQQDLPVTDDGSELHSNGETLEQYVMEKLASHSMWYHALRQ